MNRPKLLFYVESLLGIGHLVRAVRLLEKLSERFDCSIVSGSDPLHIFRINPRLTWYKIPSLYYSNNFQQLHTLNPEEGLAVSQNRITAVIDAFMKVKPDILMVEMFPFGRHALLEEVCVLFELAAKNSLPRVVSVRDICVYPEEGRQRLKYKIIIEEVLKTYRPLVLVHAAADVHRIEDLVPSDLRPEDGEFIQTGYIGRGLDDNPSADLKGSIYCSLGGGRRGNELLARSANLFKQINLHANVKLIAGLYTPPELIESLSKKINKNCALEKFDASLAFAPLKDVRGWIVSGGYNTWMDVLATRVPTLIMPLDEEQEIRTTCLMRFAPWVRKASLKDSDSFLTKMWRETVESPKDTPHSIDLDGAVFTRNLISSRYF